MTDMMQLETIEENAPTQSPDLDPDQDEELDRDTKQMSAEEGLASPDIILGNDPVKNILPASPDDQIALVLKVLALMCDGQYKPLQDYLRHQPDNIKTANLVAESTKFLQYFYTDINNSTVGLVIQLLSTLVEFASGNPENQVVIFEENIIDYINHILRSCKITKLHSDKVLEIKTIIGELLMCLMEQRTKKTKGVIHEMMHLIDRESLRRILKEEYKAKEEREDNNVGFRYFFLLEKISEWTEGAGGKGLSEEDQVYRFYRNGSACIEIMKDGDVHRAHFTVSDWNVLRDEIKEKVKWNIDRSSATGKLRDLVGWSKEIIEDVDHQKRVRAFKPLEFFVRYWPVWNNGAIFLSLAINIIMLATWKAPGALGVTNVSENATELPPEIHSPVPLTEVWYSYVLYCMGGLHNILSFVICLSFFLSNRFKTPELKKAVDNTRSLYGQTKNEEHKTKGTLKINLIGILPIYYLCFLGFSLAGTFVYGYFFAFHLLNIIYSNQLLQRVMQAITKNGRSLLWVMVLGVIVIYIFSLVAFALLRGSFDPDGEQTFYCATLYECTVTILRYGIIGEMFEFMQPNEIERSFRNFGIHTIFHLAFFILITTIGLNIIFGIIVDTFSELRDVQWDAQNDMRKLCFICGRESYEFEKHGHGFQAHVKKEHNMWDYIYFFIHLREKDKMDYTDLELYVHKQFEQDGFDFFPLNRAMVLDNLKDDEMKIRVDEILQYVHALSRKQEAEQLEKKKEEERRKQIEWQERHRGSLDVRESQQ